MSAKQALKQIPITQPKMETVTLTQRELENFAQEIADMINEGKPVDIRRAIHNARYLAEIDKAIENIEAGRYTEHELIEIDDEDDIAWTEDEDNE